MPSDCADGGNWYDSAYGYGSGYDWSSFYAWIVGLSGVFEGAQVWLGFF